MSNKLLKLSLYSAAINIVFTPFIDGIARIFGYITIILFLSSVVIASVKERKLRLHKDVAPILCVVIISFVVSLPSIQIFPVSDLIDKIIAVFSFLAFYFALSIKQPGDDDFTLEDLFYINYILCTTFIVFAFGPFDFKYEIVNEYSDKLFTMGLGNPNGVSLYVMFTIVILMIQFNTLTRIFAKIINVVMILIMFNILFLLSSRTVFLCALVIVLVFLFRKPKLVKWISYFILLVPVIMIVLQLYFLRSNHIAIQVLYKAIDTGRPEIFVRVLNETFASPIKTVFGNLCENNFYNYHNGLLTILVSLGFVGIVAYLVFWNKQLKTLRELCTEKNRTMAFIAIIAILLQSSSEAMGVVGTIPYSIFIVVIIKIARGEIVSRNDKITTDRI